MMSVLGTSHQPANMAQLVTFMQSARARGIDTAQLQVATCDGQVLYAVLPMLLPGKTMVVLSGFPRGEAQVQAARGLIPRVVEQYTRLDLSMMQALLDPGDQVLFSLYQEAGFHRLAELIYLEAAPRSLTWKLPDATWALSNYQPENHEQFARAISASYQQSHDCPELTGIRDINDVIAGHKAAGEFDPANWFLLTRAGEPAGVLLLAKIPASDALELVYIGLAPAARRQGISGELLKLALATAARLRCGRLTTAVDSRNLPAMRMYLRGGMQRIGSRVAVIRVIHRHG